VHATEIRLRRGGRTSRNPHSVNQHGGRRDTERGLILPIPQVEHVPGIDALPRDWPDRVESTWALGDGWLARGTTPLLSVPSALVPETRNVLLNPAHPDATQITVVRISEHVVDARLLA
jgi:RES domain-containing protein